MRRRLRGVGGGRGRRLGGLARITAELSGFGRLLILVVAQVLDLGLEDLQRLTEAPGEHRQLGRTEDEDDDDDHHGDMHGA
ncbi:Uncharacterised protein [Mycobacteroides abscessus subsp. abscessus]|nr:Uncharacterised protein [Mycobacteroides abscessus subsp. abscessus]